MSKYSSQSGQSVFEAIVALAIFGLSAAALVTSVTGGIGGTLSASLESQGAAIADEGIEAVRSIHDGAWNEFQYPQSQINVLGGQWQFNGVSSPETIGIFTRTIDVADVCRDNANVIVACPGVYIDPHTKNVTVTVTWQARPGLTNSVKRVAYFSNWGSQDWIQTDWSGGTGQTTWSNVAKYDSSDGNVDHSQAGQVQLAKAPDGTWATFNPGISNLTQAINGISVVDPNTMWAVMNSGKILKFASGAWTQFVQLSGAPSILAVDMVSGTDGWAVGASGKIFRYTSSAWSEACDTGATQYNSISMADASNGWIVGSGGALRKYDGSVCWSAFTPSPAITADLNGVYMLSANYGVAVGTLGKVYQWNGTSWTNACSTLSTDSWNSVFLLSQTDGWIVGNGGKILKWNNGVCTSATSPTTRNLSSIFMTATDDAWAVGANGTIVRWAGTNWANATSPTSQNLRAVAMASPLDGWAMGNSGTMVRFTRARVYQASGNLTSSAFDMTDNSPVQEIEWDGVVPACSPTCSIKFQIQTADSSTNTGVWTGPDGTPTTYFTLQKGERIPTTLNGKRWTRYKVFFAGDPTHTPVLNEVRVNYK